MAKAKKSAPAEPTPKAAPSSKPGGALAVFDSVYRFLASVKLAVITLGGLAAALAYATWFESTYGTAAVQEWVYQTRGFSILLAFLGANILCAALIRFPWKRRQTGFVITHAGLLILLAGCWYHKMRGDEGQVALMEGDVKEELVRTDQPVVRVREIDPNDPHNALHEWELPFKPGSFAWGPGQPRLEPFFDTFNPLSALGIGVSKTPTEVLTRPADPFQLVVKSHIPASVPAVAHTPDPSGTPMARIRPKVKPPGMPTPRDLFPSPEDQWFASDSRIYKVVRNEGPAQFAFLYVDRPELVEDFLKPPAPAGDDGVVRIRYADNSGKSRSFDLALSGQEGKPTSLPDSDLTVKFLDLVAFPAREAGLGEMLGAATIPIAEFEVTKGSARPVKHFALAGLPMFPNVIPTAQGQGEAPPKPLVSINYDLPPALDPRGGGLFGVVEVLGTPDKTLFYRVFGRPEAGKIRGVLRSSGPLKLGQEVVAFGGNPNLPMTLSFDVEEYLTKGVETQICEPIVLPRGQMGNGIAASEIRMTVKGSDGREETRDFFIRRSNTLDQVWKTVSFPSGRVFQVAYDVDRKPLGFALKLDDFQREFDPGTEQASRFASKVRLTDKAEGLNDKPITISMNEPLTHRTYTFYQSSYIREEDPRTGRETGRVQSVLQVGSNPGRRVIYLGSLLVVIGSFVQFYMRAGVFSARSRPTRERAAKDRWDNPYVEPAHAGAAVSADEPL